MADPSIKRGEIKALTALRGLAAMAVVLQHFSATAQQSAAGWIPSLVPHGYMAVDFFFVLSGFIMSYTYLDSFERLGMGAYLPFLWKRVARIFPLGLAVLAVILLAGAIASLWRRPELFIEPTPLHGNLGTAILINALHLQGFFAHDNLNAPSWSISVELAAYVLFPALILLLFRAPRWAGLAFILLCAGALIRISALDPNGGGIGDPSPPSSLIRCVAEFSFGMLIYRAYRGASPLRAIGRDRWTWLIAISCAACFVLRNDLLAAFSFPLVVLAFALNRGWPSRLLSSRVPYFLGTISFSIYLVHHLFRAPERELLHLLHPAPLSPASALLFAVLGSLSVLPFAAAAYYAVERPGRTALNRLVGRLRSRNAPAPIASQPGA